MDRTPASDRHHINHYKDDSMKLTPLALTLALALGAAAASAPALAAPATEKPATRKPFLWENATVYFLLTDRFNNAFTGNDLAYDRVRTPVLCAASWAATWPASPTRSTKAISTASA
jgi:hypothetical protein